MKITKNKHPKLRSDLPLMGDKEAIDWADSIIKNTHRIDILILAERVNEAIEQDNLARVFERVTVFCDRCDLSYPEHTLECRKCLKNDKLRTFKIHDNMEELAKNWK